MTDTQASPAVQSRQGNQGSPAGSPGRSSPGRRRLAVLAVLAALVALAVAAWLLVPRGGGVTYLTEPAAVQDLEERVEAPAVLAYAADATADLRAPAAGVVTALRVTEGQVLPALATLFDVGGVPVTGLSSPVPLYRDLEEDLEGDDVRALEDALAALGLDTGTVDGVFDATTAAALRQYQTDNGLEQSETLPLSRTVWLPPSPQVVDVLVRPGDAVQPGVPLASVARTDGRIVTASLDSADVGRVALDDTVVVELDGLAEPQTGTVTAIPPAAAEDGTFPVTVRVESLPEAARVGMEGNAYVRVDLRSQVVMVPVGAVAGTDEAPTVRVLVDGEPETRAVVLGLVTAEGAEIVEGVAAGEAVVVGEQEV